MKYIIETPGKAGGRKVFPFFALSSSAAGGDPAGTRLFAARGFS